MHLDVFVSVHGEYEQPRGFVCVCVWGGYLSVCMSWVCVCSRGKDGWCHCVSREVRVFVLGGLFAGLVALCWGGLV